MVDALDLGSSGATRGGSSPSTRTIGERPADGASPNSIDPPPCDTTYSNAEMDATVVRISRIGASHGIVLPDGVFAAANAKPDDEVVITVTGSGTIQIARSTASVSEQLEKAKDIARRYQNALRELAK